MPKLVESISPQTIIRTRLFIGALLLLAALLTWGIGLTLSSQGQVVVDGTEHVRTSVVVFKRKGAVGTLILSVIAAWLLFPRGRPKQAVRDWALILLLGLLGGGSVYTLIFLQPSMARTANFDENFATTYVNDLNASDSAGGAGMTDMNAAPVADSRTAPPHVAISGGETQSQVQAPPIEDEQSDVPDIESQQANAPAGTRSPQNDADPGSEQ